MGEIISFVGQKGGTGKSTLARAFAAEAAKAQTRVLIADLDDAQRTSWDWGRRRAANHLLPAIDVEMVPRLQVFTRAAARAGRTRLLHLWATDEVFTTIGKVAALRKLTASGLIEDLLSREVARLDPHGGKFGVHVER